MNSSDVVMDVCFIATLLHVVLINNFYTSIVATIVPYFYLIDIPIYFYLMFKDETYWILY